MSSNNIVIKDIKPPPRNPNWIPLQACIYGPAIWNRGTHEIIIYDYNIGFVKAYVYQDGFGRYSWVHVFRTPLELCDDDAGGKIKIWKTFYSQKFVESRSTYYQSTKEVQEGASLLLASLTAIFTSIIALLGIFNVTYSHPEITMVLLCFPVAFMACASIFMGLYSYKEGHYECYIKWGDKRKCGGVRQTRSYLG